MPDIKQMMANAKPIDPKLITNPIDRIMSVKNILKGGMRISIYGQPKTGKTRLLATFPKPILIIGTEDGTDSISNVDGVDFVPINHTNEVEGLVNHAINGKSRAMPGVPYKTLGLDNATTFQMMRYAELLNLESVPLQRSREQFKQIDNQEYAHTTKQALNHLFKFKGNVVFTAHERDHTTKDGPSTKHHEELTPVIGSSISKGVAEWLNGICDHVCQMFKRQVVEMVELEDGDGTKVPVGTNKGEYCLRLGAHPVYMAGIRIPLGSQMPDVIVNPNYDKLKEVIDGRWKPPTEKPIT